MSARRLVAYVFVRDEHGRSVRFGPHDEVPGWAAEQIRNQHAWEQTGDEGQAPDVHDSPTAPPEADEAPTVEHPEPPPRAGRGSGATAWASYAREVGVQVGEHDSRDDIITALEAAGIRTD